MWPFNSDLNRCSTGGEMSHLHNENSGSLSTNYQILLACLNDELYKCLMMVLRMILSSSSTLRYGSIISILCRPYIILA